MLYCRYNSGMFQIVRPRGVADVVVIGSGAGGGTVTKVLTDLGVNVTLLEAGPMLNPARDFKEHMWPYQVPHRGSGEGGVAGSRRGREAAAPAILGAAAPSGGSPPMPAVGNCPASRTPPPKTANSCGFVRAFWAGELITTAASRCDSPIMISNPTLATA